MNSLNWDDLGIDPDQLTETSEEENGYNLNAAFKPAPIGRYVFLVVADSIKWGRSKKDDSLYLQYDALIQGGDYDGKLLRYNFASSKKRSNKNSSQLEDMAFALGFPISGEKRTLQDIAEFIEGAINSGTSFSGKTDYESYCKDCGKTTIRFAKSYDKVGKLRNPVKPCPICGKTLIARDRIAEYYVS